MPDSSFPIRFILPQQKWGLDEDEERSTSGPSHELHRFRPPAPAPSIVLHPHPGAVGSPDDNGTRRHVHLWIKRDDLRRAPRFLDLVPPRLSRDIAPDA